MSVPTMISLELHARSSPNFEACFLWPWLVLIWRRIDTLCISCFLDDVISVLANAVQRIAISGTFYNAKYDIDVLVYPHYTIAV